MTDTIFLGFTIASVVVLFSSNVFHPSCSHRTEVIVKTTWQWKEPFTNLMKQPKFWQPVYRMEPRNPTTPRPHHPWPPSPPTPTPWPHHPPHPWPPPSPTPWPPTTPDPHHPYPLTPTTPTPWPHHPWPQPPPGRVLCTVLVTIPWAGLLGFHSIDNQGI